MLYKQVLKNNLFYLYMKKIFTVFGILILSVFLFFGVSSCNNGGNGSTNAPANSQSTSEATPQIRDTQTPNIAYINVDSVIQNYDMFHDLKGEYEKKATKLSADFDAKWKVWQKDVNDFEEKCSKELITRSQMEEQSKRLQARNVELQEKILPQMKAELEEEEVVMLRQIHDALLKYVRKYNEDKKYSLILNGATVLIGFSTMDITAEILQGLNEEYIANKGK